MRTGSDPSMLRGRTHYGFTYVGVLAVLTVMMLAMGAVAEIWHTEMQRENEQELLFVGNQFRSAIGKYYVAKGKRFPPSLEELLGKEGDQTTANVRFLRKIYRDPITGKVEWGIIQGLSGGVVGVYSLSEDKPYKTSGFSDADYSFVDAKTYSDWRFVYEIALLPVIPVRANTIQPLANQPSGRTLGNTRPFSAM